MVCAALFAMMMPADTMAKNKCVPKIYAFGFAASFNDSTVYFTEIHEVDSVWINEKNKFLLNRNDYSNQLKGYLDAKGIVPVYDEASGQNYGEYTSDVDGRLYQIWLEDQDSIRTRMEMIREYDLAGVASWCIGWESGPEIWQIIASYMN